MCESADFRSRSCEELITVKRASLFQNAFETRLLVPEIVVYAWNYGLAKKRAFENIEKKVLNLFFQQRNNYPYSSFK